MNTAQAAINTIASRIIRSTLELANVATRHGLWWLAWAVLTVGGAVVLAHNTLSHEREVFDTQSRIAHRLLSQRVVQHDAVLATLALLDVSDEKSRPDQRLPSVYPQILSVQRRDRDAAWPDARQQALESESRRLGRAVLGDVDLDHGRYQMMLAAQPNSYLLQIDVHGMVPWNEWPMPPESSPVRLTLGHSGQTMVLQQGNMPGASAWGWDYSARKVLAAESQPLEMEARRHVGVGELPWGWMVGWAAMAAVLLKASHVLLRQRADRQRAEELLRLGQVARLNTLGELAAGMAHELNQPLTAVLANTQAAARLLNEDDPDLPPIRQAMAHAVGQAKRASEVVGRLRRVVEQPGLGNPLQELVLQEVARKALYLLEPEFQRLRVASELNAPTTPIRVRAEPVALDQIIHNLLMNALQAMERTPATERALQVSIRSAQNQGGLTVQDSGPGIAPDVLPRIFEPFFTTREGGLGLGLNLCETLAEGMGGSIQAQNLSPRGAAFTLQLPLAQAEHPSP
jgi:C4-dicarboxylate-specific signal transduction histidine kinase